MLRRVPCQKVYKSKGLQVKRSTSQKVPKSKGLQVKRSPSQKIYKSQGPQSKSLQKSDVIKAYKSQYHYCGSHPKQTLNTYYLFTTNLI